MNIGKPSDRAATPVFSITDSAAPHTEYQRRLDLRRAGLQAHDRQHTQLGYLRLAAVGAGVAIAYAAFSRGVLAGWWLLLPAAAFFWLGSILDRVLRGRASLQRAIAYYERALARLAGRWAGAGETGSRFLDEHHVYAQDLDLFGAASLFELLCSARTRMGEEMLASWLLSPADPEIIRARQAGVVELAPALDLREDLAVLAETARSGVHSEALAQWGERPPLLRPSAFRPIAWLLSAVGASAVVSLLVYLAAQTGVIDLTVRTLSALRGHFLLTLIVFVPLVASFKKRTERIFHDVEEAAHDLALLAGVLRRLEVEQFASERLAALRADLDIEGLPPSRRIAQLDRLMDLVDSRDTMFVHLIGPVLLWDIHVAYAIEDWRRQSGPAMRRWLRAVGEFEALSSLAGYRYEHPHDVFPEFLPAGSSNFEAEALGHPLLAEDRTVTNDVSLTRDRRLLIVSGSNMSGKSTLLRSIGVNAVLAHAGAPVRAKRLTLSPLLIGASIRIQDSLQAGASRFYAEITRLSQVMKQAADRPPLLFLIDEMLHGTNSHDRRVGAEAIVRGLLDRGAIGLITTHDLALAQIAEVLGPRADNVHFEDHLENGRMQFDYRLRAGVVTKSNAIELMRSVGLEVDDA